MRALARATRPASAFEAIGNATAALLGPGLLTINAYRRASSEVVRLWSSDKAAYPVGGSKRKADTPWTRWVLHQGEVFVGEGDAALEAVFDDIAVIRGLGLSAVVNRRCARTAVAWAPLTSAGARRMDGGEVAILRLLAQMVAPALIAASRVAQLRGLRRARNAPAPLIQKY
ncbi:GAF domain-containing protein [Cupriavidus basilensis]